MCCPNYPVKCPRKKGKINPIYDATLLICSCIRPAMPKHLRAQCIHVRVLIMACSCFTFPRRPRPLALAEAGCRHVLGQGDVVLDSHTLQARVRLGGLWAWGVQATFISNVEGKDMWSRLIAGEIQLSHAVALQGTAGQGGGGGFRQRFILFIMQVCGGAGLESRRQRGWVRVHIGGNRVR